MADVAKQEQPVETTPAVDQKATPTPEKTVENSPPPADADKGKGEENSAKDEKTETAGISYYKLMIFTEVLLVPHRTSNLYIFISSCEWRC